LFALISSISNNVPSSLKLPKWQTNAKTGAKLQKYLHISKFFSNFAALIR